MAASTDARADHDALIRHFAEASRDFLAVSAKRGHTSSTFDMRRRTLIGTYTYYDHLPWVLDQLAKVTTPEALGARGRRLCGCPTNFQINALIWAYLIARENELLLGRADRPPEELEKVVEWWAGTMGAYREVGLVPSDDSGRQRVIPAELVEATLERHGRSLIEDPDYGKVTAGLQIFNYVQRGEQRGTTFFHGPYELSDGGSVFVEEFSRLRRDELPWTADPSPFPVDTVCALVEIRDVELTFDLFQGMSACPPDVHAHALRVALLTCDDEPRPLEHAERKAILVAALEEQRRLFKALLSWNVEYKVAYGAYLYLDFLVPILEAAGCSADVVDEVRGRFDDTVSSRVADVMAVEPVPVWEHFFTTGGPIFSPMGAR